MDSLPDSLYMDYAARSSSSTSAAPPNNAGATSALSASELSKIRRLIPLVNLPRTRSEAITQLTNIFKANKVGGPELGLLLWECNGTMFSLLEELMSAYRLLHPPRLTMNDTKKVCNALVLIQCIAFILGKRVDLLNAQIPTYFYSYMNTESPASQYDYLRLSGLGVIGALVKETGPDTPNIVRYLLQAETVPVCLRCMEMGSDLTKSLIVPMVTQVATLILGRIFSQEEGKAYIGSFVDRFYVLTKALQKVVDEFTGIPPPALLRNILICYLRLNELSRLCRCSDALKRCYPMQLRHPAYLSYICDGTTRGLADQGCVSSTVHLHFTVITMISKPILQFHCDQQAMKLQVRIWDPGITRCDVLKQHLEDKANGAHSRSSSLGKPSLTWFFCDKNIAKFIHAISPTPASSMSSAEISIKPPNTTLSPFTYVEKSSNTHEAGKRSADDANDSQYWRYDVSKRQKGGGDDTEKLCFKFITSGSCPRGEKCHFRHDMDAREQSMRGVCFEFLNKGKCEKGEDCTYKHTLQEERSRSRECWFCLSSPNVESHLITSVGENCYCAIAKGPLVQDHVLILPIEHLPNTLSSPPECEVELVRFQNSLKAYFKSHKKEVVFFEWVYIKTSHANLQVIPIPVNRASAVQDIFNLAAEKLGFKFIVSKCDQSSKGRKLLRAQYDGKYSLFYVELPGGTILSHPVEENEKFPVQFGREVLAGLLNMADRADWRNCKLSKDEEIQMAERFKISFEEYDPNR
ncbi:cwfJ-like family protein / zinc finger (CCCH-type) family protein [Artemisia annua]|uniref:CwfJ-like family protein / zinc finger (CCCH-type) family protein n=1 Tax=Artemisia annua TaxID=35608 RepID=A0A2U1NR73_ARTAN|nr:cwfJ-like family protein / zinc finger (CCCH-type) family protein [Artemisia annua]